MNAKQRREYKHRMSRQGMDEAEINRQMEIEKARVKQCKGRNLHNAQSRLNK